MRDLGSGVRKERRYSRKIASWTCQRIDELNQEPLFEYRRDHELKRSIVPYGFSRRAIAYRAAELDARQGLTRLCLVPRDLRLLVLAIHHVSARSSAGIKPAAHYYCDRL